MLEVPVLCLVVSDRTKTFLSPYLPTMMDGIPPNCEGKEILCAISWLLSVTLPQQREVTERSRFVVVWFVGFWNICMGGLQKSVKSLVI